MIPKINANDYGWYTLRYYDPDGNTIIPDSDMEWRFTDSENTLQFTATLVSDPAITQQLDGDGIFFLVEGMVISSYALGIVKCHSYAKYNIEEIVPYPLESTAFEVVEVAEGYCIPLDIKEYSGVDPDDLEKTSETALDSLLQSWILDVTELIDKYCNTSWEISEVPRGVKNICMRMVSNLVAYSTQRRKSPLIQISEFNIDMITDEIFTDEIKTTLDLYKPSASKTPVFAMSVALPSEDE